ncbi:MAG: TonB-dependent receptor [Novosphingobium sp.]
MSMIRNKSVRFAALMCATAMTIPLWAAPALAQGAAEDNDGDIIVTAQRRSERLVDVPMTETAVSPETRSSVGVNTVRDLQTVTTGFQIGNSGSYPQPAIRGITTTNAGAYENNVATFIDGLYQATPQVLNMDLPNVQSIQILKGPQGTLYGRNATGGAILIDTIDPGNDWTGNVEATYGRFNDYRARAFVAGPLSDKVGVSLSGTLRHTDGYYKRASRTTPGQFEDGHTLGLKQESIRAKLKFNLTDAFSATLGYNYTHADDPRGVIFTPIENVTRPYTAGTGDATRPRGLGEVAGDVFDLNFKQHEGMLKLELDTGIGKLRSVTGYASSRLTTTFDFGGSYVPDNYSTSIIMEKTWQENLDFSITSIDNLDLVIGGNYYNIKTEYDPSAPNAVYLGAANFGAIGDPATTPFPLSGYRKFTETFFFRTKEAWALFADATFHATDQLSINVGGRYTEETQNVSGYKLGYGFPPGSTPVVCNYSVSGEQRAGLNCGATVSGVFQPRSSARTSKYSKFTPRASIRFELSPRSNIYFTYSRGFRSGEWNSVIPSDNPAFWLDAKPETADGFEIGFKHSSPRLRFELAGFYSTYKDLQVSFTQNVGGVAQVILQNAPKASIYGIDASIDYEVTENFKVRAGATWLHARYGDGFYFTGSGVNPASVVCASCGPDPLMTFANVTASQNLSGLQMSRAPDFTGFVGFEYNIPKGDGGLKFAANLKYTSSYVVTNPSVWGGDLTWTPASTSAPDNTQIFRAAGVAGSAYISRANEERARQKGYALLNASVTWTDPSDHYYVRVWGNNLTDIKYRTHYNPLSNGTYSPIGEPLTFGGTIGYKF